MREKIILSDIVITLFSLMFVYFFLYEISEYLMN